MSHIDNIAKGVLKEFPLAKGILEEYDSEKIEELDKLYQEEKIKTLESLIEAINNLNPNTGREVIIKEIIHIPKPYYHNFRYSCYGEDFDADKLKVEIRGDDSSKSFIAFLVNIIFHNDERDTTIHNISLTAYTEKKNTTTIPDMIKLDGKWEKFDINEFACRIDKNTSKRLCFRFISRDFLDEPEVLIKLTLNHTSGFIEVNKVSKFMKADTIDDIKWAIGSNGGKEVPTVVISNNNPSIPSFHTDGGIPKWNC